MTHPAPDYPDVSAFRRPADVVMRLARMGSAHPSRLSFLRVLLRRIKSEGWQIDRPLWQVDANGVGRAVYRAKGPARTYSLVAFAHDLPDDQRSDRVIATAWDATFALFDGEPDAADLARLAANVPLQEAGRVSPRELTLARANRSVRLFRHVVNTLAKGTQPTPQSLDEVGYLMRTTAVYGAGKFGAADRAVIADRDELSTPFQAEMLTVWLIRAFTVDLVDHLAATKGGAKAVPLDRTLRRRLGVGNSTGLGMAPFLVRHPVLLNNWMAVREEALARVRALPEATGEAVQALHTALTAATDNAHRWRSDHPIQKGKLTDLRADLARVAGHLTQWPGTASLPWNRLWLWAESALTVEGQEALASVMLEPHGDLVDGLTCCLGADEAAQFRLNGAATVDATRAALAQHYDWALRVDFTLPDAQARFWYVSEEKLEPRLGARQTEPGADREQPLGIARMAADLDAALVAYTGETSVAEFALRHPEHRLMLRRVQIARRHPYAEVRDNLIAETMLPIDLMRCKLAFFGASHFDPRSDKWVRISLFQGEPFPDDLSNA